MSNQLQTGNVILKSASSLAGRILFACSLCLAGSARAATLIELLAEADRQELASNPTWLRLLHYDGDRSEILDDDFFLDPAGRTDPRAELNATLRGYFQTQSGADDNHPRCRFPARYHWLASRLELPDYRVRIPPCVKLEAWALFDQTQSISLLLVSGYLGSPASTFGHSLLRFNSNAPDDQEGLFDLALNFGALIPEYENPLLYIFRGLTGRYEAGFSDKYYYTQDLVYSRTEFRDIWEYRLNLSEFQRTLMILHMWEIVGKKFRYYFLNKNCGYRIAEMLQLVLEEDEIVEPGLWYAPVALFHRMGELDGLIESVRYIPSARRQLYHDLKLLDDDEMELLDRYAGSEPGGLAEIVSELPEQRRTDFLDGLTAYQHYRIAADRPDSTDAAWQKNHEILLARLSLPPSQPVKVEVPQLRSPADGFRPADLTLGYARDEREREFATLGWSPFKKESVGRNSLEGNELAFLDVSLGLEDGSPAVFLDRLDLLRILSLNPPSLRVRGDRGLSWRLRCGVDRWRYGDDHDYRGVLSFGAGRAWQAGSHVAAFGLLNLVGTSDAPLLRLAPELGLHVYAGRLRGRAGLSYESTEYDGEFELRWQTRWMLQLGSRQALSFEIEEREEWLMRAGLSRFY